MPARHLSPVNAQPVDWHRAELCTLGTGVGHQADVQFYRTWPRAASNESDWCPMHLSVHAAPTLVALLI